jgi:hypothetical protein
LVRSGIRIKSGRTGRGVYYRLNPTYKGDIRGHETYNRGFSKAWCVDTNRRKKRQEIYFSGNIGKISANQKI